MIAAQDDIWKQVAAYPAIRYGSLSLPSRYHLSPLAGYTNRPFRQIVRRLGGVGLTTTDLVNARGLLDGSPKSLGLIEAAPEDRPFAVQIFGGDAIVLRDCAQFLEARGIDAIDINMGCPVQRVTKGGAGASLMCQADSTVRLVQAVVEGVRIPVSVKMRLGWDDTQLTAPMFAREFEQVGVAAVAIHGRTRAQGFSGQVNRDGIRQVVEAVERIPVIANGDIRTIADGIRMFAETGCRAISMGRGALANPWIFRQFVEWETTGTWTPAGTFAERLELLRGQLACLIEWRGEARGISSFRKMAHWYLRGMQVPAPLRNEYQQANTYAEAEAALMRIIEFGPTRSDREQAMPDLHIPVPSGPIEHW
jgi:tRNA-dihydrouridine synthase B